MKVEAQEPVVEFHDLTVSYHKKPVLWNIDMTLPKGALIGIIGPNGAGKSTLIKSAMGLLPLASGYVRIFDEALDDVRHRVSYVPQRESVDWDFPTSVLDVVLMGRYAKLGLLTRPRKADKEMALNLAESGASYLVIGSLIEQTLDFNITLDINQSVRGLYVS